MSEPAKPANVIEALAAVMKEAPGINKGLRSEQGYSYRGIEQVTAVIQPLLGKYGVVFVPRVVARFTKDLTINGKPWTEEQLSIEFTIYGPGGVDDRITVGPLLGFGRDNSDKGANKALTQAFKYALLQTLCIGDAKDDGDQQTHEADGDRKPTVHERAKALTGAARGVFGVWLVAKDIPTNSGDWSDDHEKAIAGWLDHLAITGEAAKADTPSPGHSHGTGGDEALGGSGADPGSDGRAEGDGAPESGERHESGESDGINEPEPQADAEPGTPPAAEPPNPEDIKTRVAEMNLSKVRDELTRRDLNASGTPTKMRKDLTLAMLRELIGQDATE